MSLAKNEHHIRKFVGDDYDVVSLAEQEAKPWLEERLEHDVDVAHVIRTQGLNLGTAGDGFEGKSGGDDHAASAAKSYPMSLTQLCELNERIRVFEQMSGEEKLHLECTSSGTNFWIRDLPLKFKKRNLMSDIWLTAIRRRLYLDVFPREFDCRCCVNGFNDLKGEHAVNCAGASSLIIRHNAVRDLLAEAARQAGFNVLVEQKSVKAAKNLDMSKF